MNSLHDLLFDAEGKPRLAIDDANAAEIATAARETRKSLETTRQVIVALNWQSSEFESLRQAGRKVLDQLTGYMDTLSTLAELAEPSE